MEIVRVMVAVADGRAPRRLLPPARVRSHDAHVVVGGKRERMLLCKS
jgi:hypothetical protein